MKRFAALPNLKRFTSEDSDSEPDHRDSVPYPGRVPAHLAGG